MSCVMCHMSHVHFLLLYKTLLWIFLGQIGGPSLCSVCYQRGLPRLVYKLDGLGPIDNRRSTNLPRHWYFLCDTWYVTCDMWHVIHDTKKIRLIRQNLQQKKTFLHVAILHSLWDKFSDLSILFPQGFQKSNKLWHWTLGSGGKKTFKHSKQRINKSVKNFFFAAAIFFYHFEKNCLNMRQFLSITFAQGFRIYKKFLHWASESGSKKTVKRSEKVWRTNRQTDKQTNIWTF